MCGRESQELFLEGERHSSMFWAPLLGKEQTGMEIAGQQRECGGGGVGQHRFSSPAPHSPTDSSAQDVLCPCVSAGGGGRVGGMVNTPSHTYFFPYGNCRPCNSTSLS